MKSVQVASLGVSEICSCMRGTRVMDEYTDTVSVHLHTSNRMAHSRIGCFRMQVTGCVPYGLLH